MKKNIPALIIAILIPLMVGFISSTFTTPNIPTWYAGLNKPSLNPPNWLFGPVWTLLYILMGIASYLIFISTNSLNRYRSLIIYGIQLVLNFFWSFIFFSMQNTGLALAEIIAMWITILITIFNFNKINKTAAYLLIPYILWVSFATYLNASIHFLN